MFHFLRHLDGVLPRTNPRACPRTGLEIAQSGRGGASGTPAAAAAALGARPSLHGAPPLGPCAPLTSRSVSSLRSPAFGSRLRLTWRGASPLLRRQGLAGATTAKAQPPIKVDKQVEEYWRSILEGVDKPTAKRMVQYVDPSLALGVETEREDGVGGGKKTTTLPPLYAYHLEVKKEHPDKVSLVRVGEFYETLGIDAVLLVQYAGLNPMGVSGDPAEGCDLIR